MTFFNLMRRALVVAVGLGIAQSVDGRQRDHVLRRLRSFDRARYGQAAIRHDAAGRSAAAAGKVIGRAR